MKIKKWVSVFVLAGPWLCSTEVQAQPCEGANGSLGPVVDAAITKPAAFDWQGEFLQDNEICFLSRQSGAELKAYLLAPANVDSVPDGSLPVIVIGPGSSGTALATYYLWSARDLAGHGYLALAVDPQGVGRSEVVGDPARCGAGGCPGVPFQLADNFIDGLESGTDYVFTREHPWLKKADLGRVGLAGHSLSSRAANYIQGIDPRIGAVVAWDNLASTLEGDAGTPSGGGACGSLIGASAPGPSIPVIPRVPTLGEASDAIGSCNPTNTDPDIKKTGFLYWREAGVPSMEVVFKGSAHGNWAQSKQSVVEQLQAFEYYTRAWFDLYLKGDESARGRLAATEVLGQPLDQLLSSQFRSALFLPESALDCADLVAGLCLPANVPGLPPAGSSDGGGVLLGALSWLQLIALLCLAVFKTAKTRHPLEASTASDRQSR